MEQDKQFQIYVNTITEQRNNALDMIARQTLTIAILQEQIQELKAEKEKGI